MAVAGIKQIATAVVKAINRFNTILPPVLLDAYNTNLITVSCSP